MREDQEGASKRVMPAVHVRFAWIVFAALVLLMAMSVVVRLPHLKDAPGAPNLEAPWHVLLTVQAQSENPLNAHYFLPIVTLGAENDKGIKWGSAVPSREGHFFYTSFSAIGFAAPKLFFWVSSLPVDLRSLMIFNIAIQISCCTLLWFFLVRMLVGQGMSACVSHIAALAGTVSSIFSCEALLSQGLIFWHQSIYQLILIGTLLTLQFLLEPAGKQRIWVKPALLVLCALGPWTEWTGFITNAAIAAALWKMGRWPNLVKGVIAATALAALLLITHLLIVVKPHTIRYALLNRFLARTGDSGSFNAVFDGYLISYGLFLVAFVACAAAVLVQSRRKLPSQASVVIILVAFVPLLENLLLAQHASEFSFDRLKFLPAAAIIIAMGFSSTGSWFRGAIVVFLGICVVDGVASYRARLVPFEPWPQIDQANRRLREEIGARVDLRCAILMSQTSVRGYSTVLFGRNIVENTSDRDMELQLTQSGGCAAVYLYGTLVYTDLPNLTGYRILWPDHTAETKHYPIE